MIIFIVFKFNCFIFFITYNFFASYWWFLFFVFNNTCHRWPWIIINLDNKIQPRHFTLQNHCIKNTSFTTLMFCHISSSFLFISFIYFYYYIHTMKSTSYNDTLTIYYLYIWIFPYSIIENSYWPSLFCILNINFNYKNCVEICGLFIVTKIFGCCLFFVWQKMKKKKSLINK